MRSPNVRACVEVFRRLTLEGHYGGVLVFLTSSVRSFVELVMYLTSPPAFSWSDRAVKSFQIFIPEENSQQHGGVRGALLLRLVKRLTSRNICPTNPY